MTNQRKNHIREGSTLAQIAIYAGAALFALAAIYPVYYVLVLSLSSPLRAMAMNVYLMPDKLYLDGYKFVFQDASLWLAYRNSLAYALGCCALRLLTCVLAAYPLTSPFLLGRKWLVTFLLIPMYFSGGVITQFILYARLGLYNNPWVLVIPEAVSIWHIILTRSYFRTIPETLREAARIDGADSFRVLSRIYVPMAKPILAVIALYTIIGSWNSWFNAAVYITNADYQPLQIYLRKLLVTSESDAVDLLPPEVRLAIKERQMMRNQLKFSVIIVSTLPMLILYPFFQKYFVKGVMLGSLKE